MLPQLLASFVAQLSIEPFTIISMAIIIELCQNSCDPKRTQTYMRAPRHVQIMTICSSGPTLWIIHSFDCAELKYHKRGDAAGHWWGRGGGGEEEWETVGGAVGGPQQRVRRRQQRPLSPICHLLASPQTLFVLWLDSLSERVTLRNTLARLPWNLRLIARCGPGHCL